MVGAFLGYDRQSKGFCIYIPASKKIIVSKDVKFDKSKFFFQKDFMVISQALVVQYVFPPSESRSYNVATIPSPTLDIPNSNSPIVGASQMYCLTHHQDSHEIDLSFSTRQPSQQSKCFTS